MYNPLLTDISKLKDTELESKIIELTKKYSIAARMGHGMICDQLVLIINLYKEELQCRNMQAIQKTIKKQDKDFDDLINIE